MIGRLVQELRVLNRHRLIRRRRRNSTGNLVRSLKRAPIKTNEGFLVVTDRKRPVSDGWELVTRKLASRLLPRVSLFVNVGANIGFYCCMAQQAGIRTIALEPEPANCQFFLKNMAINGFTNDVELFPVAAGHPPPRISEIYGSHDTASLSAEFSGGAVYGQFVPVASLDDIVLRHRWLSENVLVLVDVEGWEQHVLEGAPGLLALDPKPLWIVEVLPDSRSRRMEPTQVFSIMFENGYRAYRIAHQGELAEVTEESVPSLMSSEHPDWNYLFIDSRLQAMDYA